jgi:4-hydroxy-4-methyl-2-oxoglutarate aldolase
VIDLTAFLDLSPTMLADVLDGGQIMDASIRPLPANAGRAAGPAFTVRCARGDNVMLHAAIYRAPPGSIVVVESGDTVSALAGGGVCAMARKNGIAAFVLDGAVRDIAEIEALGFPVFGKCIVPKAAKGEGGGSWGEKIRCGGVEVAPNDIIVADRDGVVVVPSADASTLLGAARKRAAFEGRQSLEDWEKDHRVRISAVLLQTGLSL